MAYSRVDVFARLSAELDEHPTSTLAAVAARLQIHRHTVTEVVRAATGLHFRDWRSQRLFARCCQLLRNRGTLSIKEISVRAGFSSTTAFDRFIKRCSGRRPTELERDRLDDATVGPAVDLFDKQSARER